ncbi:MAG: uncharacterized protein JWL96_2677 [Sphingomonas bacterium]|uniref:DUF1186 domain-containing protein n=1 Tax=Sphingomonas bacterium TaxID=1895847 RepID=UPI002619F466|nr:DUF1186 domain-containing protein [Sphingomonas bacterium]MDB5710607.1 uncharacterized protein [Sphingomonas bacterium]
MDDEIREILERARHQPDLPIEHFIEELATSEGLPRGAIIMCTIRIDEAAPELRAVLARVVLGNALDEAEGRLLFRGLHILGGGRDSRTCAPLLRLLRRPIEDIDELVGDALTESMSRILAGVFDGDVDALLALAVAAGVDEFVRDAVLGAAAFLAWEGRIDRGYFERFLIRFFEEHAAEDGDHAWCGWQEAVALLGLRPLEPLVERAFAEERIAPMFTSKKYFDADLAEAESAPDDIGRFERAGLSYIEDVVAALEWTDVVEDVPVSDSTVDAPDYGWAPASMPVINHWRNIGRNDPCPCGSGKKFKKCCLP